MMICMGHLYGVVLYYSTSTAEKYFNDVAHSRPEFLYFWVYYFGFNLPWVVVPSGEFPSFHYLCFLRGSSLFPFLAPRLSFPGDVRQTRKWTVLTTSSPPLTKHSRYEACFHDAGAHPGAR